MLSRCTCSARVLKLMSHEVADVVSRVLMHSLTLGLSNCLVVAWHAMDGTNQIRNALRRVIKQSGHWVPKIRVSIL